MAKNRVYAEGDALYLPVIAGTVSGHAVCVGFLPGVAVTDRDSTGHATVQLNGAYDLEVTGAIAAVGDPVYINPATGALTVAAGVGLVVFGAALKTKAAAASVIPVRVGYPTGAASALGAV